MSYANLDAAGRAWESSRLNDHLRDWDVSEARDRAIEARAAELLELRDADGYHPFGDRVALLLDESYTAKDMLIIVRHFLEAGDYAAAGEKIVAVLRDIAEVESAEEAAIQIDKEWNEASGAALDAYDDRGRHDD